MKHKKTVAIAGVGLMGGSLGLALKKKSGSYSILGIGRHEEKLKKAKKIGACDFYTTDFSEGAQKSDILVICTPVFEIAPLFKRILPSLKKGAIVTDIGSVKSSVLHGIHEAMDFCRAGQVRFVGSHPMAGSEKTGVEYSRSDLYENATVVLSPLGAEGSAGSVKEIKKLWESAGAKCSVMNEEIHDILVAQTSHLPHVLASAFVHLIASLESRDPKTKLLLAGSFKDVTRIVDSDPDQWAEIASSNQKFLTGALKSYRDILNRIIARTESSKEPYPVWKEFFSKAKKGRVKLLGR